MTYLSICRVCLSGNLKIHSIRNTPLQVIYEKLTRCKLTTDDGRPETVCYICHSQLERFRRILDKSQKSEEILTQLFDSGIEILQETVAILNRGIQHDFCSTPIEVYCSKDGAQVTVKEEQTSVTEELMTIKNSQVQSDITFATMDESEAVLCRVCLVGDVRTCSIRNTKLQAIYENLTSTKLISEVKRPEVVCYICHSQLLKCRKFINRSRKSENILTELFRNGIQLTEDTIASLNSRMKANFRPSPVQFISYCSHGDICKEHAKQECIIVSDKALELESAKQDSHTQRETTNMQLEETVNPLHTRTELEVLICNVCGHKCKNHQQLENHSRLHDPERRYPCDICSYRYSGSSHLSTHKQSVHQFNYKCNICNKKFIKLRKFNMHMLIHTEKRVYKCERCKNIFKHRNGLQNHYRTAHPGDKHHCDRCSAAFTSLEYLRDHIINIHGSTFPYYICDKCRKKFKDKVNISKHIYFVHMKRERFECDDCGKVFHRRTTMQQHLTVHAEKKPYECSFCPKTFGLKPNFMLHLMNHTGEKPYVCQLCDKRFRDKNLLKLHSVTHNKSKYTCNVCNKRFYRKGFLKEHMQTHVTGVNNIYTCDKCGKEFTLNSQLKIHMYIHKRKRVKEKKVICKVCFKKIGNLKRHMRTHTGEKPYCCKQCKKSFSAKGNLTLHQRCHSGDRPFACSLCDKRFSRSDRLKIHELIHNGENPHTCPVCDKSYSHKSKLQTHMKRHNNTDKTIFPCEQCDKVYAEKRTLECHKTNYHTIDRKQYYICDMCFKVYTVKSDFIYHIKTHSKPNFTCDECKRVFPKMSLLAEHMKDHSIEKTCTCTRCRKVFVKTTISRHIISVHGSIKPYACNTCEEGFLQRHKAYNHYVKHHRGERPYGCELCDKSFKFGYGLKRHIMRAHKQ